MIFLFLSVQEKGGERKIFPEHTKQRVEPKRRVEGGGVKSLNKSNIEKKKQRKDKFREANK